MGVWNKSPQMSAQEHARLQALISADPEIRALREEAGRRSMAAGRSAGWNDISQRTRDILRRKGIHIPDGYDVNMDGELVYTNKTPFLQQAAWGALPIGAVSAVGALAGPGAAGASAAGGGASGVLPSSSLPVGALMGGGAGPASNILGAAATGGASGGGLWQRIGRGAANAVTGNGFNPWQQAALAALAGLPALLANKGPSDEERALLAQARQMAELQQRRVQHQNPLFQAVTQLAMSRLPTASQRPLPEL